MALGGIIIYLIYRPSPAPLIPPPYAQTVTILLAYETGHFATKDVSRVGLGMLALTVAVVLLVALPWWSVLGLPPT